MRLFLEQGSGKLINMLGHGAKGPVTWQNAYAASKGWVRSFTISLANETRGSGVGVYAYQPGMVLTDLLTNVEVVSGHEHRLKSFGTIVRLLAKTPEEAAKGALRLASPATDGKTGLIVEGSSMWRMLGRFLGEGLGRLVGRRPAPVAIHVTSIPKAQE
jgi:NAD(P)-dependent dehydrogenase (short-subunit alcohol dehydrogenase family)